MFEKSDSRAEEDRGVIVFDGACGACSAIIGENKKFFECYGFRVVPIQEASVVDITGIDKEKLQEQIHLFTPDGRVFRGIDFVQFLSSKVWWMMPLSVLLRISFLKPLFRLMYLAIAKRRYGLSKACGLESRALYK